MNWKVCIAAISLAWMGLGTVAQAAESTAAQPVSVLQVSKKTDIHVVYDIDTGQVTPGTGIGRGLYYVRGLLESYRKQGVKPEDLDIHVVLHGRAAPHALGDDAFALVVGDPFAVNPNKALIRDLIDLGVKVEVCNVTLKAYGLTPEDVLPGVQPVFDAYTRLIDLQQQGYAYIKFD